MAGLLLEHQQFALPPPAEEVQNMALDEGYKHVLEPYFYITKSLIKM